VTELGPVARVEQRWQPVRRAGFYVPGGKAVYPSSVVMNVVPAQVAGVASVVLASPPQAEFGGSVHPTILAAAGLLGVADVYAMGGAGAIGALAYGVPDAGLEAVDMVTGPGNVFVAAAKRLVRGVVGIDAEAGPTEILVIADAAADPVLVAADLLSQAEHDELAAAILVTDAP
jgi:histidinol dehydrogenase